VKPGRVASGAGARKAVVELVLGKGVQADVK
jgi:hypothetical protein